MLTICYMTNRRDPHFEWFAWSLAREFANSPQRIKLVIVDFWADEPDRRQQLVEKCNGANLPIEILPNSFLHVQPKPCVWQGQHRLTKEDWFAAANARNTALCCAADGYIVYVDDLSVLMPGWFKAVQEAMAGNYVVLGAYKKVRQLRVENGNTPLYKQIGQCENENCKQTIEIDEARNVKVGFASVISDTLLKCEKCGGVAKIQGVDSRWNAGNDSGPVPAAGSWMFGCSVGMPVETLLSVGGWPEFVDGMGSEDYLCGMALQNAGFQLKYDRRMLTLESEEDHFKDAPFVRRDKGVSPNDKSHAALRLLANGCKYFPNYYEGGIRKLRDDIRSGKPFPTAQIPQHDWYDGQPICEMTP